MSQVEHDIAAERLVKARELGLLFDIDSGDLITIQRAKTQGKIVDEVNSITAVTSATLDGFIRGQRADFAARFYHSKRSLEKGESVFTVFVSPTIRDASVSGAGGDYFKPSKEDWLEMGRGLIKVVTQGKDKKASVMQYEYDPRRNIAALQLAFQGVWDHGKQLNKIKEMYAERDNIQLGTGGQRYMRVNLDSIKVQYSHSSVEQNSGSIQFVKNYTEKSYAIIGDIDKIPEHVRNKDYFLPNANLSVGPGLIAPMTNYNTVLKRFKELESFTVTEITKEQAEDKWQEKKVQVGIAYDSIKGEDRVYNVKKGRYMFTGLFDGHGGANVVNRIIENIDELVSLATNFPRTKNAAKTQATRVFLEFDEKLRAVPGSQFQGATGLIAIHDIVNGKAFFYHIGDSRAVWRFNDKNSIYGTEDHKPLDEQERIDEVGGWIEFRGVPRVNGILATSRAFGDFEMKAGGENPEKFTGDPVSREPEVSGPFTFRPGSTYILASDGVWDVMSNEAVIGLADTINDAQKAAEAVTQTARKNGSHDDIGVAVIKVN